MFCKQNSLKPHSFTSLKKKTTNSHSIIWFPQAMFMSTKQGCLYSEQLLEIAVDELHHNHK
jgi:hypothetical protein